MIADAAHADAFADGQRQVREADRVALVAALHLPPETTWEEALARVVPVAAGAKGCHGCRSSFGMSCSAITGPSTPARIEIERWITDRLGPDLLTPKPGAPECPGRVSKEQE